MSSVAVASRPRRPCSCLIRGLAAALVALAAPVAAQTPETAWTATLTVKDLGSDVLGCSNSVTGANCSTTTVLSDDDLTYDSTTYAVTLLQLDSGDLEIRFDTDLAGAGEELVLNVDGAAFSFKYPWDFHDDGRGWIETGLSWTVGDTVQLSLTVPQVVDICDRTAEVADAILEWSGQADCAAVTDADLASVEELYLRDVGLTSLSAGDFSGLTNINLKELGLVDNSLTSLPAGIFSDLQNVESLDLSGNNLATLPVGVFDGMDNLGILTLTGNELSSLPDGLFDSTPNLVRLLLKENALTSLPPGLFDGTKLFSIILSSNEIASLPPSLFGDLPSLSTFDFRDNLLANLPARGESRFSALA